ncbi:MAG: hypothetical protein WDW38_009239 [Sanguina aurantia]
MDESQVLSILHGLTSGDSKTTQYMMNKYYTEDTVFEHAFYFMRGRKAVYSVWRGAFGLLLVEPHFIEYWAKDDRVLIKLEMHCKGLRILPILNLVIPLVTTLRLRKDSDGTPLIAAHHDYITTEILDRNLGWPYMVVVDYIVKPCFNTWFWCAAQFWDLLDGNKVRVSKDSLASAISLFPRIQRLEFDMGKAATFHCLSSLPLLSSLCVHNAPPSSITALLLHPGHHGAPGRPAACPSLTSLTFNCTLHSCKSEDITSALEISSLVTPCLSMGRTASPLTTLTTFTTNMVPAPSLLLPVALSFPSLTTLDVSTSPAVLAPPHIAQLFKDLPLLRNLAAKTTKPRAGADGQPLGSCPARDARRLSFQDLVDACVSAESLPAIMEVRAMVSVSAGGAAPCRPPPAAVTPASSRAVSLWLGHVSYENTLAPLGAYFPKLQRLECWAVSAADFVRAGPSAEDIAAHAEKGDCIVHTVDSSSGSGSSSRDPISGQSVQETTSAGSIPPSLFQPGRAWLQRFPALQTLTLWMDPRDLPCRGGVHLLHLELPRLRILDIQAKPRPYPITFTGSLPWLCSFRISLDGRQRQVFRPMMEGLGELLSTSRADRLTIIADSTCSKFSLSKLDVSFAPQTALLALLTHPIRDTGSPLAIAPACPSLTSLTYNITHHHAAPMINYLVWQWIQIAESSSFLTSLTHLETSIVAIPSILIPLSLTFPFLTSLDLLGGGRTLQRHPVSRPHHQPL